MTKSYRQLINSEVSARRNVDFSHLGKHIAILSPGIILPWDTLGSGMGRSSISSPLSDETTLKSPDFSGEIQMSKEQLEIDKANRETKKRLDDLTSFDTSKLSVDKLKVVERRRNAGVFFQTISETLQDVVKMQDSHKLLPEDEAGADNDPTTLVIRVRNSMTGEVHAQAVKFSQKEYETLRSFTYGIADDNLERFCKVNKEAGRLLMLKHTKGKVAEKQYITSVLYQLAELSETFKKWIFAKADEYHPLFSEDGTLNRNKLPSDSWTVFHLKGGGQVPIQTAHEKFIPTLCDNWFFHKVKNAAPLDRRFMAKDYDMQGESSRIGIIIKLVQRAVERYWQMVRPADKDKDYYFPLKHEVPFVGQSAQMVAPKNQNSQYHMSRDTAQLFFVPNFESGPQRFETHQSCIRMGTTAHLLESFASAGGELKSNMEDNKEGSSPGN